MLNSRITLKYLVLLIIIVVVIAISLVLIRQKKVGLIGGVTVTPMFYPISETFLLGQTVAANGDQTVIANGIEMRLVKIDIMSSSEDRSDNTSLNVDTFLCFDKPNQDDGWSIGLSNLKIGDASAKLSTNTLLFDSIKGYIGEEPKPDWLPLGGNKRCSMSSFLFASSAKIIWQLANGLDVTTPLTLTVSELRESDLHSLSFEGPWEFHIILIP